MKEIEFVCHNSDYPASTPLKKLFRLFYTLRKKGYKVYMQDFSDEQTKQYSLAVGVFSSKEQKEIELIANTVGVDIDFIEDIAVSVFNDRLSSPETILDKGFY